MAHHQQGGQPSSARAIKEKNRRNHMMNLFSMLKSLLPNSNNPRGRALSLTDQIDEAINHIKNLETKVKMAQEKKESLMQRKRSRSDCLSASVAPKIVIHEMGSMLQIILTCGFDNQFIFSEIIGILHEHNIEVKSAQSSLAGNTMFNVVHAEILQYSFQLQTTKMTIEKLKRFVYGHGENF